MYTALFSGLKWLLSQIKHLKVIVTVKSSGGLHLQIGFGPLIIDYFCHFLFDPLQLIKF